MNDPTPDERFTLCDTREPTQRDVNDAFDSPTRSSDAVFESGLEGRMNIVREEWHLSKDVSESWVEQNLPVETKESWAHLRFKILGAEYLDVHNHEPLGNTQREQHGHDSPEGARYDCFEVSAPYGWSDVRCGNTVVEAGDFQVRRLLQGLQGNGAYGEDKDEREPLETIIVFPYTMLQSDQRLIAYRFELAD